VASAGCDPTSSALAAWHRDADNSALERLPGLSRAIAVYALAAPTVIVCARRPANADPLSFTLAAEGI